MPAELVISRLAKIDLAEGYDWHEEQQPGLGEEWMAAINQRLSWSCEHPEANQSVYRRCRRAVVRRFSYSVFYQHKNDVVTVHAILHWSRDPHLWRARLP